MLNYNIVEQWVGRVEDIPKKKFWEKRTFLATLYEEHAPQYFAEIFFNKIPFKERKYIKSGATFKWTIYKHKQKEKGLSVFVFDRPKYWTKEEIENIEVEAKKMGESLAWGKECL